MTQPFLVMGLGNPGPQYAGNRHNIGYLVAAELAERMGARFKRHRALAEVAEGTTAPGSARLIVARPLSFMNLSGGPTAGLLRFYGLDASRLIVVHDELDLPFDTVRIKVGGGHGGHNGVRDIQKAVGTPEFVRVRVGIGRPPGQQDPADFVLRDFAGAERMALPNLVADATDAVVAVSGVGVATAQQRFHARR